MTWLKQTGLFFTLVLIFSISIAATETTARQTAPLELTEEEQAWLSSHPVIRLSAEADWPPFEFAGENGKLQGTSAEYLEQISQLLGVHFLVEMQTPWKEKLEMLRHRELDAVFAASITRERQDFLDFTQPYFLSPNVIVTRKDASIMTLRDSNLKVVAIESAHFLETELRKHYSQLNLLTFDNTVEALEAVSTGQAQVYVGPRAIVSHLIDRNLMTNLKIAARAPFPDSTFHIAVRRDWPILKQLMQKALNHISFERHQSIRRKWIPVTDATRLQEIPLTDEERAWLQSHPVIKVGGESNWPPYDFVDEQNRHVGVSADMIKILGDRLGVSFEVIPDLGWTDMLDAVRVGDLTAAVAITQTPSRQKDFIFTTPYALSPVGIVTRNDTPDIQSLSDLNHKRVAIPSGYADIELLRVRYPDFNHLEVDSILEALQAVQNRKADAFIGSAEVATYLIDQNQLTNLRILTSDVPIRSAVLQLGISKHNPVLASILQKTLNSVSTEEINVILRRWVTAIEPSRATDIRIILSADEQQWLSKNPVIKFTGDPNWLPFEAFNENEEYIGIVSEIIKLIETRTGLQFNRIPSKNWLDAVRMANEGEVDVLSDDVGNDAIKNAMNFTAPYLEYPIAIVMRNEQKEFISDLYEIADKRIAVIEGYGYIWQIFEKYPDIEFIKVKNIQEALLGVSTGEVDAFISSFNLSSYHINQMGLNNLKITGQVPVAVKIGLGVRKELPELYSILNKAVATLTEAEKFKIAEGWMQDKYIKHRDYRPWLRTLAAVGLVLLFLLMLFFIWNRTLQQQVEKRTASLHTSRSRLANAQAIAHLGHWEWSFKSDVIEWSDEVFRILGSTPNTFRPTGALFATYLPTKDRKLVIRSIKSVRENHQPFEVSFKIRRRNHEIRRVNVQAQPVLDEEGLVSSLFGTIQDITTQYKTEQALRTSEAHYRKFFETNTAGILHVRHDPPIPVDLPADEQVALIMQSSIIEEANTVYSRLLGYQQPADYIGNKFSHHIDENSPESMRGIEEYVRSGYKVHGILIHVKDNSGKDVSLLYNAIGIVEGNELKSSWVSATDMTEHIQAEQALRDSEEKFSKAFSSSPDAITFTTLPEGKYLEINQSYEQISGYTRDEVLGHSPVELGIWTDESQLSEFREQIQKNQAVRDQVITFRIKSGEMRTGLLTANLINLKGQTCIVVMTRDITEKIQLEEKTRQQELQLLQANKMTAIGTLVAGVAHEINNPNHLIQINAEILSKAWPDIERRLQTDENQGKTIGGLPEDEIRETLPVLLQDIHDASIRINRIVTDLKDFSRPQDEHATTHFNFNEAVESALNLLAHLIKKRTDAFTTDLAADIPEFSGNRQYFEQIVVNLLTNALESLTDKTQGVSVSTNFNNAQQQAVLQIRDQGCGIKPEHLSKLYDPFFTTRQSQGGTGLGLAITYNLLRQFHGTISVDSQAETGTTFTVLLPIKHS